MKVRERKRREVEVGYIFGTGGIVQDHCSFFYRRQTLKF